MREPIIDFIRHGEPEGGSIYRGNSIDDPLSEKGWAQMWSAVGDACPWEQVVSSPMLRCRAFAEKLALRHDLPLGIEPGFREVGFGEWEGRDRNWVKRERADEYTAFYSDPVRHRPPAAEPLLEFVARVSAALDSTLSAYPDKPLLVVAHAGVIRAVVATVLAIPAQRMYHLEVSNAGITRLRPTERGLQLVRHSCASL